MTFADLSRSSGVCLVTLSELMCLLLLELKVFYNIFGGIMKIGIIKTEIGTIDYLKKTKLEIILEILGEFFHD